MGRSSRNLLLCLLVATSMLPVAAASATSNGAFGWGNRRYGAIGDGTEIGTQCMKPIGNQCAPEPTPVSDLGEGSGNSVAAIEGGIGTGIALLTSGEVLEWGTLIQTPRLSPQLVSGLSGVTAVAAGHYLYLALLSDGTVRAWGKNGHGDLGDGTTEPSETPVEVVGLHEVVAISAKDQHALALLANGTVMSWGSGADGQLGNGQLADSDVPVQVLSANETPLSEVTAISAGGANDDAEDSVVLKRDGSVWVWGNGEYGQLGNATAPQSDAFPVKVKLKSGATAISAGGRGNIALLGNGKVMSWGWNGRDELGNGTPFPAKRKSTIPVEVSGLEHVTQISAGESFRLALLSDGTVRAWGWNLYDEVGNEALTAEELAAEAGESAGSATPLPVSKLHDVVKISAGPEDAYVIAPADAIE
jgi:alpha-tubulin suppressor-like RCC1 family protein